MEYVNVRGDKVPAMGFGTWQIKGDEARKAVKDALETGYRHIDTAQAYENERRVGQAIDESDVDREDIFLTTKVWRSNAAREDVLESTRKSLERLNTDYVDLLLLHWPNDAVDIEETIGAMKDLKDQGLVRHIGVSNFPRDMLDEAVAASDDEIFCDQVEYHPYLNQDKLLEYAQENDIMITAYSPLARGKVVEDEVLQEIGDRYDKTPVQVALRWLLQQENVAAIPKSATGKHRKANFDVFDFRLTDEEMSEIHDLTRRNKRLVDPDFGPEW